MSNNTETFQWNDELVKEFVGTDPSMHRCEEDMKEFKERKSAPPPPKRVEVKFFGKGEYTTGKNPIPPNYDLCLTDHIDKKQIAEIQYLIESYLNGDVKEPLVFDKERITKMVEKYADLSPSPAAEVSEGKGWEITEVFNSRTDSIIGVADNNSALSLLKRDVTFSIHTVRRLSDGETFSIGDKVGYDDGKTRTKQEWAIDNFFILESDNEILARGKDNINVELVDKWLYKSSPATPKGSIPEPLFTTEDGKPVFHGENYWWVAVLEDTEHDCLDAKWSYGMGRAISEKILPITKNYKHFSTREAAEAYCNLHKPCLSAWDICNLTAVYGADFVKLEQDVIKLAKSKTKQQ